MTSDPLLVDEPQIKAENLFCSSLPSLPQAWDSTMLGLLKECPKKFEYIILQGRTPRGFSAHLEFGLAYPSALEHYDKAKAEGQTEKDAVLATVERCMNYGLRTAAGTFEPYDASYTGQPTKTRETLVRAVIWYLEQFKNDPAQTVILANGQPAVELSFKVNLDLESPDGDPFILCGHLDRLVTFEDRLYWLDRKTSKSALNERYWRQFTGPNNQFSLYTAATQLILHKPASGGIVDAVELGANFARFQRRIITKSPGLQSEWLNDTYRWISLAAQFAADEHWPMNDKSCNNYNGCPFLSICAKDPKVRQGFLEHEGFEHRRWNPLESR